MIIGVYVWVMRRLSRNLVGGIGRGGELGKFLKPRVKEQAEPRDALTS